MRGWTDVIVHYRELLGFHNIWNSKRLTMIQKTNITWEQLCKSWSHLNPPFISHLNVFMAVTSSSLVFILYTCWDKYDNIWPHHKCRLILFAPIFCFFSFHLSWRVFRKTFRWALQAYLHGSTCSTAVIDEIRLRLRYFFFLTHADIVNMCNAFTIQSL